jgi:hypothetical protein
MGFSRPQLVVVSGLFRWESLNGWDFLGHNLLLSQASFFTMEFRLSRSLSHELFSFFTMELWLSRSLSYELSFFTMEFWLSRSLSHELSFFTMEFWLSRSLSHELSFFTMEFWLLRSLSYELSFFTMEFWLSRSLSHELSFFTMEFWLLRSLSHELSFSRWNSGYHEAFLTNFFFHDGILKIRDLGEDSFYTYITKSIYIGSSSLKTLPLDLEPPLQGKEYSPSYSNTTMKRKANVFSRNHL